MRIVLSFAIIALCWQYSFAGTEPELEVLSHEWDFGRIEQGTSKEKPFFVKNKGFDDLVIDNIHTCCGYGLKTMSSWTIAPGAKAEVTIVCDASRKPLGKDIRYITILSNCVKNPHMRVAVKADIVPGTPHEAKRQDVDVPADTVTETGQVPSFTVDKIYDMISTGKEVFMLDVREKGVYQVEFLPNSIRYAKSRINEDISDLENVLRSIDKKSVIIVYCAIGVNSADVVCKLQDLGYNAYNMEGGIAEWQEAGYPTDTVRQ
jgi:rhodanese-related sulfurtransferase